MPKVSIIIPTYNVERYLVECMDSVVNQTLKDIEIICINDGSTDGSLAILQRYADEDKRIVIVDKENGGYGIGMNIGLDMATGEYIGIVEPDDFVPINMYEDLYAKAKEFDLDFVKADFYRFGRKDNGDMDLAYNHLTRNEEKYNIVFNPSQDPQALRFIMNTWSGIYKKSFLDEFGIRHNETPGASFQDNGFYFQTFVYGRRAMIINKPYYMNRRDNPNSSVRDTRKVYCVNAEYDYIRRLLVRDPEVWNRFMHMYWFKKYSNYRATVQRISDDCKLEYIERFRAEFARGFAMNEIDLDEFSKLEKENLAILMESPERAYEERIFEPSRKKQEEKEALQEERHKARIRLKKAYEKRKKEVADLTEKLGKVERRNEKLEIKVERLTEKSKKLEAKVQSLKEKIQKLKDKTAKQEAENQKISKELKDVKESLAFRFGKSLFSVPRAIKNKVKK